MSLSNTKVACPLDCYDACQGEKVGDKIRGSKENKVTNGNLCRNFYSLVKEEYLKNSIYENEEVSLDKALDILVDKLKNTKSSKVLYYKGSGNLGVMQSTPKNFFTQYGACLTKGSLCDGGGGAGVEFGRGSVTNPPIEKLLNSDIVIVWGRNLTVTSSHMYKLIKDKTFITIDPIKTKIAKKSQLHLQINPKTDHELALMLTRVAYMNKVEDEEFLEEHSNGHDWFFDISKNRPLVSYEKTTGIELDEVYKLFELIENKKVALLIGLGVQKYFEGAQILRCIDSFAAFIGIHKKQAGGVWYLSDSKHGYEAPFKVKGKNEIVPIPEVDFSKYDLVFIQGANPLVSSPRIQKIIDGLENTFVVCFTTTYNDTCKYANLIIPSSSFLCKKDVRLSYGHEFKSLSQIVEKKDENTLSEYEITNILNERFDFKKLKNEDEIIDYYVNHKVEYEEFDTFEFIEDIDIEPLYKNKKDEEFYFVTAKSVKSLNSQFHSDNYVYLHPSVEFDNGSNVKISSKYGEHEFIVKHDDDIKENCAFFFSGNKYANYLTPNKEDEDSSSAMFQEVLLSIELS